MAGKTPRSPRPTSVAAPEVITSEINTAAGVERDNILVEAPYRRLAETVAAPVAEVVSNVYPLRRTLYMSGRMLRPGVDALVELQSADPTLPNYMPGSEIAKLVADGVIGTMLGSDEAQPGDSSANLTLGHVEALLASGLQVACHGLVTAVRAGLPQPVRQSLREALARTNWPERHVLLDALELR
jgi:hypothetical protein